MKRQPTQDQPTIKTDSKWKPFIYGYQLTRKEKREFDYMDAEELEYGLFLRYRGRVYSLDDFMRIDEHAPQWMKQYHGYHNDTYFSGTLIKLSDDGEAYQIAYYYS